jgi:hypothetical protein
MPWKNGKSVRYYIPEAMITVPDSDEETCL